MTTPSERRDTVQVLVRRGLSQRKALRYVGLSRRIASYAPRQAAKDQAVAERLLAASPKVPRFGSRRMAAWLDLGEARVRRLWRRLGLNIPRRRPRRRRSGNDIRLPRKLPRQADTAKEDFLAVCKRYSAGVMPPRDVWGRCSL